MLWRILVQFLFRLSFGLAVSMSLTSSRQVTSGFFRVHLLVLLGINTFVSMVVYLTQPEFPKPMSIVVGAGITAVLCYFGTVIWLYEKRFAGFIALLLITGLDLYFGWFSGRSGSLSNSSNLIHFLDVCSSGFVLGTTFTSMLLGHWYLNTPSMKLDPLKRLLILMLISIGLRAIFCGIGAVSFLLSSDGIGYFFMGAMTLRWLSGLIGLTCLTIMAWKTLQIPNTQSATGILYVGVIFVFIGELASQLLSVGGGIPL